MRVVLQCKYYGKNDNSTESITNAGAQRSYFFKMVRNVHLGELDIFVHLENVSIFLTDSYGRGIHLGEMDVFVHRSEM